jgi:hypothetical protein
MSARIAERPIAMAFQRFRATPVVVRIRRKMNSANVM